MKFTMRWFGEEDPVSLEYIRQVPGVTGIVSALYDIPVGEVWPLDRILELKNRIEQSSLSLEVVESVPVHESIKLGLPDRDVYIDNFIMTLKNLSEAGVRVVAYNFMPVFDWFRTSLHAPLPDGSTSLCYDDDVAQRMDPLAGDRDVVSLPGWSGRLSKAELRNLMAAYREMTAEDLWRHLAYFLRRVIDAAEKFDIKLAIHPDDPPWPIFGLPRIIVDFDSLERLIRIDDRPHNGITFCTGSLGANPRNDLPAMIRHFGRLGKIHFAHVRNIKWLGERSFQETAHRSDDGALDMVAIMKAFDAIGYAGPVRSDHGRMIWDERGRPGYGLYDRALGTMYLYGIWETLKKTKTAVEATSQEGKVKN